MQWLGDFLEDATVYIPFNTFTSDDPQASATITNLADADIKVHKDGSATQIVTDGATVAIDFDTITGNHLITIDTSAHADYAIGSDYMVRIEGTTVDAGTINAWVGSFSIENRSSSLNATALAALEDQFDGTGLSGDTYPSTQSQLSGIANVGSAIHRPASSYTLTTGTQSANTYTSTEALDGTRHEHTDATGVLDIEYHFTIGSGTPSSVQISGYLTGSNDDVDVFGYDWVTAGYKQIGNIQGSSSTSNSVHSFDVFVDMVGSGADEGKVDIMIGKTSGLSTATLAIDQIFIAYSAGAEGYDSGSIWIDTTVTNTNTVVGVDGVARNPVSTMAAANTLSASTNLNRFMVAPGSSITLAAAQVSQIFNGHGWTLALGGQNVSSSLFHGADVSGTGTTATGEVEFSHCHVGAATIGEAHFDDCGMSDTVTAGAAGDYTFSHCYSEVAGAGTWGFDFVASGGNVNLSVRDHSGGLTISNKDGGTDTDSMTIEGNGQLIVAASSSGAISSRGNFLVTNTGGATITNDDNTANIALTVADTNELQTNQGAWATATGFATEAKQDIIDSNVDTLVLGIITGAAATGTLSTTQASSDLTGYTNDQLIGRIITVTSGVAEGESSDITDYVETNGVLTFTAMTLAMGDTDTFKIT